MKAKIAIFSSLILTFIILGIVSSNQITNTSINQNSSNEVAGARYAAANTPIQDPVVPNPDCSIYRGYVLDAYSNPIPGAKILFTYFDIINEKQESGCYTIFHSNGYFDILVMGSTTVSLIATAPGYRSTYIYLPVSSFIIFNLDKIPPPPPPTSRLVP